MPYRIAAGRHPLSERVFTSWWTAVRVSRMFGFGWFSVYRVKPVAVLVPAQGVIRVPSPRRG